MTLYKNAYIYFSRDGIGTIPVLRQPKDWVGGSRKWPVFADVQYCIYADNVSGWGKKKSQKYADVI